MGFFSWFSRPGKEELAGLSAEADKVSSDSAEVTRLCTELAPKNKDDPRECVPFYERKLSVLRNESYHIVARLACTKEFHYMAGDFASKGKLAFSGNKTAVAEVNDIRSKAPALVKEEIARLTEKLNFWKSKLKTVEQFAKKEGANWADLKSKVESELSVEREKVELTKPRVKEDMTQWRSYYQTRVSRLDNPAIEPVVKLVWVTNIPRTQVEALIKTYLDLLNRLLFNEAGLEQEFHELEGKIEGIVKSEAPRLRKQHPEFFRNVA